MFLSQVPPNWSCLAYASLNGLTSWYADLLLRMIELQSWTAEFVLPSPVWLSGLFNPQSFLTAIMQTTARKQELPLDKMCLISDVTSMLCREEVTTPPKEGVYINGLFMEVIIRIAYCVLYYSHSGSSLGHRSGDSPGV